MRVARLLGVAVDHARRRLMLSVLAALLSAVAAGGVVQTVATTSRRNVELMRELRTADVRSLSVRALGDSEPDLLPAALVALTAALPGVERAVAFTKVASATTARFSDPSVTVGFFGATVLRGGAPYTLQTGREPRAGEVVVSTQAAVQLRMLVPGAGELRVGDTLFPVVGSYRAPGLGELSGLLDGSALTLSGTQLGGYFSLTLLVREPADLVAVSTAVGRLFAQFGADRYSLTFDARAAEVEQLAVSAAGLSSRSTARSLLLLAAFGTAVVALLNAVVQRKEIARRRALGHSRGDVTAALLIEAALLSALGASAGVGFVHAILAGQGTPISSGQAWATAALVTLTSAAAALPGAALGAFQDPAAILRVP